MLDTLAKYVYEVYRSKSVSAAAKKLYISQPALSSSIKKAEKELGWKRKVDFKQLVAMMMDADMKAIAGMDCAQYKAAQAEK